MASWGKGEDGQLGHGDAGAALQPRAIQALVDRGVTVRLVQKSVGCMAHGSVGCVAAGASGRGFRPAASSHPEPCPQGDQGEAAAGLVHE